MGGSAAGRGGEWTADAETGLPARDPGIPLSIPATCWGTVGLGSRAFLDCPEVQGACHLSAPNLLGVEEAK